MDWNWFFSSLSQSSAAIVGIFGAFIITKVLSNQAQFGEKISRFKSLEATATRLIQSSKNLYFDWYINQTMDIELKKAKTLFEDDDKLSVDDLYG